MKMFKLYFQEVKRPTTSIIDRTDKIDRETGRLAVQVSKDNDDSLYKMMNLHRKKYEMYKKKLMDKYRSKVKSQARK